MDDNIIKAIKGIIKEELKNELKKGLKYIMDKAIKNKNSIKNAKPKIINVFRAGLFEIKLKIKSNLRRKMIHKFSDYKTYVINDFDSYFEYVFEKIVNYELDELFDELIEFGH